ncbi:MAG: GTP-binding protein, partial [Patescibacteria group bacterium]|nr:GTP-binding protein [Patescibacteria group bacterium]
MITENSQQTAKQPVVVIMGHVDHGKSSLLEAIREDFAITAKESGGITQHIGAYEAEFKNRRITFIDTPGHEAFSAMRQRGAKVADVAVLVVDATEGVKPQTKEAIKFIKQANVPMVVALNKIDKPGADAEKTKQELSQEDVAVESWGGKTPSVKVSAKTKQGINELLETILLVSEMEELKAKIDTPAKAIVIESSLDSHKGPVATLILQEGILKTNDILATQSTSGKAKKLLGFRGKELSEALPGQPVRIFGFEKPPMVGETATVFADLEQAKTIIKNEKSGVFQKKEIAGGAPDATDKKFLNVIIKADFQGSLEAVEEVLRT